MNVSWKEDIWLNQQQKGKIYENLKVLKIMKDSQDCCLLVFKQLRIKALHYGDQNGNFCKECFSTGCQAQQPNSLS